MISFDNWNFEFSRRKWIKEVKTSTLCMLAQLWPSDFFSVMDNGFVNFYNCSFQQFPFSSVVSLENWKLTFHTQTFFISHHLALDSTCGNHKGLTLWRSKLRGKVQSESKSTKAIKSKLWPTITFELLVNFQIMNFWLQQLQFANLLLAAQLVKWMLMVNFLQNHTYSLLFSDAWNGLFLARRDHKICFCCYILFLWDG